MRVFWGYIFGATLICGTANYHKIVCTIIIAWGFVGFFTFFGCVPHVPHMFHSFLSMWNTINVDISTTMHICSTVPHRYKKYNYFKSCSLGK